MYVSGPVTVAQDCAVLVISGQRSASPFLKKAKCAPSIGERAHMGWRSSSVVTVEQGCPASYRKENSQPCPKPPDFILVKGIKAFTGLTS